MAKKVVLTLSALECSDSYVVSVPWLSFSFQARGGKESLVHTVSACIKIHSEAGGRRNIISGVWEERMLVAA